MNIIFPENVIGPEEASKQRMRDAYILGAKVGEQMFISSPWFPTDLECYTLVENIVRGLAKTYKVICYVGVM